MYFLFLYGNTTHQADFFCAIIRIKGVVRSAFFVVFLLNDN
ncbi:hypothetical protein [Treponema pectinovorum]|nr:hypothetical protein [Treponema pectinovorum]